MIATRAGAARLVVAFVVAFVVTNAGCGGESAEQERADVIEFSAGAAPAALVPLPDGTLLVGERATGRVRVVDDDGRLRPDPLAEVDVATDGQRGLLGLASIEGRTFAAWTRATDGRIVVGQVAPGSPRLVWEGPPSSDLANGGHLDVMSDGRLVIGIGDLQDPTRVADAATPNGKLLALDPDGATDQVPEILSGGWNNPFAFTVTRDGEIWVADNAPGDEPERIGRGDRAGPLVELPGARAPSALIELEPGRLGLCGFLDGQLVEVAVDDTEPAVGRTILDDGCRTGAARLGDGRLAVSDGEQLILVET